MKPDDPFNIIWSDESHVFTDNYMVDSIREAADAMARIKNAFLNPEPIEVFEPAEEINDAEYFGEKASE